MKRLLISLLIILHFTAYGQSSSLDSRKALIIGIGEYNSPETPGLSGVQYDMESAKTIANGMGIPDKNIQYLRNSDATKENILKTLNNLGDNTREGSRVFVYFSGHGSRRQINNNGGCEEGLLSYDRQLITNKEFAASAQKIVASADKVITMFDACFSGGVIKGSTQTRGLGQTLRPKFYAKNVDVSQGCLQPSNQKTRGLMSEQTRLGAIQENVVQITSSRPDEVSFDEPGKGGLATQGVKSCLLGQAKDLDGSGAISIGEIQQCAQNIVNTKLASSADFTPSHVTITGNRNLIPVTHQSTQVQNQPQPIQIAQNSAPTNTGSTPSPVRPNRQNTSPSQNAQSVALPSITPPVTTTPVTAPPVTAPPVTAPPVTATPVTATPVASPPAATPPAVTPPAAAPVTTNNTASSNASQQNTADRNRPEPVLASLSTLNDIHQQRNPRRIVEVILKKPTLQIKKDFIELTIKSNHDGYVYLIMVGSDAKSFYVLFPNGLDSENKITAGKEFKMPRPDWEIIAQGPEGIDNILVMVADSKRDLEKLHISPPTSSEPFTYTLNDLHGRSEIINYLTGDGIKGQSESFGSKLISIKEYK